MATDSAAPLRRSNYRRMGLLLLGIAVLAVAVSFGLKWRAERRVAPRNETPLPEPFVRLVPLQTPLGKPQPGDWLYHYPEPGQSWQAFARVERLAPPDPRRTLEILPLGDFSPDQEPLIAQAADFLGRYYQLPVRVRPGVPLLPLPEEVQRKRDDGHVQVRTGYLLEQILAPQRSPDALALLGLTTLDLFPDEPWNYVHGQARPGSRVAVWSLYRFGDPTESPAAALRFRQRSLKIGAHELGHLLGLAHCTFCECCMCGTFELAELDRHPLELCPQCLAKACLRTGADPWKRGEELLAFAEAQGLTDEADFWRRAQQALGKREPQLLPAAKAQPPGDAMARPQERSK